MRGRTWILPSEPKYVLRAAEYVWHYPDGSARSGIEIFVDRRLVQHLDAEQAIELSNQLVDAVETAQP